MYPALYALLCTGDAFLLCIHLYRRYDTYWWRRRFKLPDGRCVTVAMSLGTRDLDLARTLARWASAEAESMPEVAMRSRESVRETIKLALLLQREDHRTRLGEDLRRFQVVPSPRDDHPEPLQRAARDEWVRERDDAFAAHRSDLRVRAALDRIAAEDGPDATYGEARDRRLEAGGYTPAERLEIARQIEAGYAREAYTPASPVAGTPPADLIRLAAVAHGELDGEPERDAYAMFARERAVVTEDAAKRYDEVQHNQAAALACSVRRLAVARDIDGIIIPPAPATRPLVQACEKQAPLTVGRFPETVVAVQTPAAPPASDAPFRSPHALAPVQPQLDAVQNAAVDPQPLERSFSEARNAQPVPRTMGELLQALSRTKAKAGNWTSKTEKQHRQLAAMFIEMVGTDQLCAFTAVDVTRFCGVLDRLPTLHGQDPKLRALSLQGLLDHADTLPQEECGLGTSTKNRYITQIGTLYAAARTHGYANCVMPDLTALREKDLRPDKEKSERFDVRDILRMIALEPWRSASASVTASLYWIVLLALYTGARLSEIAGLEIQDIEIGAEYINIRFNARRRLKNTEAIRKIPIHSELIRLGFLRFVAARLRQGSRSDLLFSDMIKRTSGDFTHKPFTGPFYRLLPSAVPNAKQQKKSLRSFRSLVNTLYIEHSVIDAVRETIMGHTPATVNGRNYKKRVSIKTLRAGVEHLPKFTRGLPPRDWSEG